MVDSFKQKMCKIAIQNNDELLRNGFYVISGFQLVPHTHKINKYDFYYEFTKGNPLNNQNSASMIDINKF